MRRPLAVVATALTTALTLVAVSLAAVVLAGVSPAAARPTDPDDARGDSYTTSSVKMRCSRHICVHWVTSTADAAKPGWQDTTLKMMNRIWGYVVDDLGYRAPLADGTRGGNAKLDVYLKDLGPKGYAGYCTQEKTVKKGLLATAYCVLDNDFAPAEFNGRAAYDNLRSTASHEFFRAVQLAYDVDEDDWLIESTATWMEERFADDVNANRKYLDTSQVVRPWQSLDLATSSDTPQFGTWVFWEYLSQRLGNGIVKTVWTKAGEFNGGGHMYSMQALASALKEKGTFATRFATYASANTAPATAYKEGRFWHRAAPMEGTYTLSAAVPSTGGHSVTIDHLASRNVKIEPYYTVTGGKQRVRINVNGPASTSQPRAVVAVTKSNGSVTRALMTLNANGDGHGVYLFDANQVDSVVVTLVNASARYRCWTGGADPSYSCAGTPKDEGQTFSWSARITTA